MIDAGDLGRGLYAGDGKLARADFQGLINQRLIKPVSMRTANGEVRRIFRSRETATHWPAPAPVKGRSFTVGSRNRRSASTTRVFTVLICMRSADSWQMDIP